MRTALATFGFLTVFAILVFLASIMAYAMPATEKPTEKIALPAVPVLADAYHVVGKVGGEDYWAIALVSRRREGVYSISWNVPEGCLARGTGKLIVESGKATLLIASQGPRGETSLCIFDVRDGGLKLSGTWTAAAGDGREEWRALRLPEK